MKNQPLILVVEDDRAIRSLITTTLDTQGYRYHAVETGAASILEAVSQRPDVMILDLGLPDMDGVDIIRKVREWSNLPIIVVSARSEDQDKIGALDAGDFSQRRIGDRLCSRLCECRWKNGTLDAH